MKVNMKENDIKVSIICAVYNHEPYLRQALDSILMQKTNFKYEILIHDDASTDKSADIIREYEQKYPDIIKPIYQTENQHSQGVKVQSTFNYPRMKGKYFAKCEGDDFWIDENKLQIQFDLMEANPNCSICVHRVDFVNESGNSIEGSMPVYNISEGVINSNDILRYSIKDHQVLFHTTSFFVKVDCMNDYLKGISFIKAAPYGDFPSLLYYAIKGDYIYIDKAMSVYRRGSKNSWTTTQCIEEIRVKTCIKLKESMILFDEYTNKKYHSWVQNYLNYMDFNIVFAQHRYLLIRKKYKDEFKKLSFKKRIYTLICWVFPFVDNLYVKVKKILHIKGF